eukprot:m.109037 g.109037  ORF g.109037 m.109037 type:complete len:379 (-) comp16955_c0_seq1:131-1267(-)
MLATAAVAAAMVVSVRSGAVDIDMSSPDYDPECVYPGTCTPPPGARHSVVSHVTPRHQWVDSGGFCGSTSIQAIAMSWGVYLSQDLVRKAAPPGGGHGDSVNGYEVLHTNINQTLNALKLEHDVWDWNSAPAPQVNKYLLWFKKHLAAEEPIVMFVYCKGDSHDPYGNGGYDHVEPAFGIYSNSSLKPEDITEWYPDDVIIHGSDYAPDGKDNNGYFRAMGTLADNKLMMGNCRKAVAGWGHNEMYPCLPEDKDFGVAITGQMGETERVWIMVDSIGEPDIREGQKPVDFNVTVHAEGLVSGTSYTLFRWNDRAKIPTSSSSYASTADFKHEFVFDQSTPSGDKSHMPIETQGPGEWTYIDPNPVLSSSSAYYRITKS